MSVARKLRPALDLPAFQAMVEPLPDDERWELVGGQAALMAPPTIAHQRIVMNILRRLDPLARATGCAAYPGIGVMSDHADDFATFPDIVVRCGPPLAGSYAKDPVLLAEVLSPSTMPNDRGLKLPFYQGIESLRAILLVYTNEVRIEHWQRTDTVWNEDVASGIEAAVALPVLGGSLTLADTYDGVAFTSIRTAQG